MVCKSRTRAAAAPRRFNGTGDVQQIIPAFGSRTGLSPFLQERRKGQFLIMATSRQTSSGDTAGDSHGRESPSPGVPQSTPPSSSSPPAIAPPKPPSPRTLGPDPKLPAHFRRDDALCLRCRSLSTLLPVALRPQPFAYLRQQLLPKYLLVQTPPAPDSNARNRKPSSGTRRLIRHRSATCNGPKTDGRTPCAVS